MDARAWEGGGLLAAWTSAALLYASWLPKTPAERRTAFQRIAIPSARWTALILLAVSAGCFGQSAGLGLGVVTAAVAFTLFAPLLAFAVPLLRVRSRR